MKFPGFVSLRNPDVRLLITRRFLNSYASGLQGVLIGWLVFVESESALLMAITLGIRSSPQIVIGPFIGTLADRIARRTILRASSWSMVGVSGLLVIVASRGTPPTSILVAFMAISGIALAASRVSRRSLYGDSVSGAVLVNAMALDSVAFMTARLVAPVSAGVLVALLSPLAGFTFQWIIYLGSALLTMRVASSAEHGSTQSAQSSSYWKATVEGVRYIGENRTLAAAILLTLFASMLGSNVVFTMVPVIGVRLFNTGPEAVGFLFSVAAAGATISPLILALRQPANPWGAQIVSTATMGMALVGVALIGSFGPFVAFFFCVGALSSAIAVLQESVVQLQTDSAHRGRVTSLAAATSGTGLISAAAVGIMIDVVGVVPTISIGGAAIVFASLFGWWWTRRAVMGVGPHPGSEAG